MRKILLFACTVLIALPAAAQVGGPGGFERAKTVGGANTDLSVSGFRVSVKMGTARLSRITEALEEARRRHDSELERDLLVKLSLQSWDLAELCLMALDSEVLAEEIEVAKGKGDSARTAELATWKKEFEECAEVQRKASVDALQNLVSSYPDMEGIDEIIFRLGYLQALAGDPAAGSAIMARLIEEHPSSDFVPEAWLLIAEHLFDQSQMDKALEAYGKVDFFAQSRVRPYAKYKAAWTLYNLSRFPEALAALMEAVDMTGPGSHWQHLYRQVVLDTTFFYSQAGEPAKALAFFEKVDKKEAEVLTGRLAAVYADQGRLADSDTVLDSLIAARPDSDRLLAWHLLRVENASKSGGSAPLVAAAEQLAEALRRVRKSFPPAAKKHEAEIAELLENLVASYRLEANRGVSDAGETAQKLDTLRKELFE
jgi:tetratricopeptide (TPR) repeat protein